MSKETWESFSRRDFIKFVPTFLYGMVGAISLSDNEAFHRINIWENPLPTPDANAHKFLLISDIHAGNIDDGARQNNTKSLSTLKNVVKHLKDYPFDRLIQMGDVIRQQKNKNQNVANYEKVLNILKQFPFPTSHLLGNHDTWGITSDSLNNLSQKHNLNGFYGVQEYKNFQIVWLDMNAPEGFLGELPEERIEWLKNRVIFKDTPTIIFSHYAFLPQDVEGNNYFGKDPNLTSLTNGQKVWEGLKKFPIHAIVSAHMHQVIYSQIGKTHMITVPAFVENMLSSDSGENPGVYSILEVNYPKKFVLKSCFGSICFSRIQI